MNGNRYAIVYSLLVWLAAGAKLSAINITEPPDFSNSTVSVGTLDPGPNTVSGSLDGNCNIGDCNPNPDSGPNTNTQDSFYLTVPTGYQITSLTVTTSAVSGPVNFILSMVLELRSGGNVKSVPLLSPLNGTTANLLTTPVGADEYRLSVYGQRATAAGAYSLNWSFTMSLSPLVPTQTSLVNPRFDSSLAGWSPGSGLVSFDSTRNASGTESGSLKSINDIDQSSNPFCNNSIICVTTFPAQQCLLVTQGLTYDFGGTIFIPSGQSSSGQGGVGVSFWNTTDCTGTFVHSCPN